MKDKLITHYKGLKIAGNTQKNKLCQGNIEHQQGNWMPFYKNYMRILKYENLIKRNRLLYQTKTSIRKCIISACLFVEV